MQYIPFQSDVQILGNAIESTIANVGPFRALTIEAMVKTGACPPGTKQLEPQRWYSHKGYLTALRLCAERFGETMLNKAGAEVIRNAVFPRSVTNIHAAFAALDAVFHMNHAIAGQPLFDPSTGTMRDGIGHYHYERCGARNIVMRCENPYPCEFDRGVLTTLARRFEPLALITHIDLHECRQRGGSVCAYEITWR